MSEGERVGQREGKEEFALKNKQTPKLEMIVLSDLGCFRAEGR